MHSLSFSSLKILFDKSVQWLLNGLGTRLGFRSIVFICFYYYLVVFPTDLRKLHRTAVKINTESHVNLGWLYLTFHGKLLSTSLASHWIWLVVLIFFVGLGSVVGGVPLFKIILTDVSFRFFLASGLASSSPLQLDCDSCAVGGLG